MVIGNVALCSCELRRSAQCSNCVLDYCIAWYHTCMRLFVSGMACGGLWNNEFYIVVWCEEFQHVQLLLTARKLFTQPHLGAPGTHHNERAPAARTPHCNPWQIMAWCINHRSFCWPC